MIKIPDKALETGAKHIYQNWHLNSADLLPPWELLAAEYRTRWLDQAAGAALAMIEAWPGMECNGPSGGGVSQEPSKSASIILPLPAEASDE